MLISFPYELYYTHFPPTFRTNGCWESRIFAWALEWPGLTHERHATRNSATKQVTSKRRPWERTHCVTPNNAAVLMRAPSFLASGLPCFLSHANCDARNSRIQQGHVRNVGIGTRLAAILGTALAAVAATHCCRPRSATPSSTASCSSPCPPATGSGWHSHGALPPGAQAPDRAGYDPADLLGGLLTDVFGQTAGSGSSA
jgi:hypothetical protein